MQVLKLIRRKSAALALLAVALVPVTVTCVPPDGYYGDGYYGDYYGGDVVYVDDPCYWGCGDAWGFDFYAGP